MINFHYLDELLSIQIDMGFYFNILSDTPDCFHTEALFPQQFHCSFPEPWAKGELLPSFNVCG